MVEERYNVSRPLESLLSFRDMSFGKFLSAVGKY